MPQDTAKASPTDQRQLTDKEHLYVLVKDIAIRTFVTNRRLSRLTQVLAEFATTIGKREELERVFHTVVCEEKRFLCDICKGQLNKLQELDAPQVVADRKKTDIESASKALNSLQAMNASDFLDDTLKLLKDELGEDLVDLTTQFVNSDWPIGFLNDSDEDDRQLTEKLWNL